MTLFDLAFLFLFPTAAVTLLVAAVAAMRGRGARARTLVRRVGAGAVLYFAVLLLVSAFTPQRTLRAGEDECVDDWCIAVQSARHERTRAGLEYEVTFRLSSRARRVDQRERFVIVYLEDERGRRYAPVSDSSEVPFDTLLRAGETVLASRRFKVSSDARIIGVAVARSTVGRFPGCCIVGDESSFFHRPTIIALD